MNDLERQISTVSNYCVAKGYQFRIIQDLGSSGLNYSKKGLKELINLISTKEINKIVINYKDRLIRFGYEMIEELCDLNGVKIEIINQTVEDVLSIITVFYFKLYGSSSHKSKKIRDDFYKLINQYCL